ncbi:MAG: hypothetical protein ACOX9E_05140 [Lentisphaeria bacterium]
MQETHGSSPPSHLNLIAADFWQKYEWTHVADKEARKAFLLKSTPSAFQHQKMFKRDVSSGKNQTVRHTKSLEAVSGQSLSERSPKVFHRPIAHC